MVGSQFQGANLFYYYYLVQKNLKKDSPKKSLSTSDRLILKLRSA